MTAEYFERIVKEYTEHEKSCPCYLHKIKTLERCNKQIGEGVTASFCWYSKPCVLHDKESIDGHK